MKNIYIFVFTTLKRKMNIKNKICPCKMTKNHNKHIHDCTLQLKGHESDICSGIKNNFVMHAKHMLQAQIRTGNVKWLILLT